MFLAIAAAPFSGPAYTQTSTDTPTNALRAPDLFEQALLQEESTPRASEEIFLEVPIESSRFKIASEELLKIYYRSEDWPRFFSFAQDYRRRWPLRDRRDIQTLEVLALLRHCQNEVVEELTSYYKKSKPSLRTMMTQIDALSKTHFRGKGSAAPQKIQPLAMHLSGRTLWRAPTLSPKNLHPKMLRVKVENLCP